MESIRTLPATSFMLIPLLTAAVVGYFLGALPFGYLVARSKGINIFEHGSKNPGATNVRRVLGKGPGNLVFFLDALKGAAAAGWPLALTRSGLASSGWQVGGQALFLPSAAVAMGVAGLVAALIGHSFCCFTGFRGGKGVATSVGGVLVLMPLVVVVGAVVWAATFYRSRYVSLASILAALSLPLAAWLLHQSSLLLGLTGLIALFVCVRHRANIARLLNGTEHRFTKNGPKA